MNRGKSVNAVSAAKAFASSTDAFVASGGTFPQEVSAETALLLLQTPVDESSRKAGFGAFPLVDHRWVLRPVEPDFVGTRIKFSVAPQGAPVWTTAEDGDGYLIETDRSRPVPEVANWSARVARAGHVTSSAASGWIWDHSRPAPAPTRPPSGPSAPNNYGPSTSATLRIDGPTNISSPGTYYWVGTSSLPGGLSISVDSAPRSASDATRVESASRTLGPGTSGQIRVRFSKTGQGNTEQLVSYNIPEVPEVQILGPTLVEDTSPVTWTAVSATPAQPIRIQIDDRRPRDENSTTVTSEPMQWPPDTTKDVTVRASAINASGFVRAEQVVRVRIPPESEVAWSGPQVITEPGTYTYSFYQTNNGGPGAIELSMSGSAAGASAEPVSVAEATGANIVLVVPEPADPSVEVTGDVTFDGSLTTKVGAVSASYPVAIQINATGPQEATFTWTLEAANVSPADVVLFQLYISRDGNTFETLSAAGGSLTRSFSATLGVGSYTISGTVALIEGESTVTYNATVSGGGTELALEVVP